MKRMLLGNEAIALGAYLSNVTVATGYPGTPSTEIMDHFARYPDVSAQWSPNEKVAMEVGVGASLAGARVIVTMKHVGLNVAADPFFAVAYMGVKGGLVVISADDPGMHSSQGEQDNRNYAKFAKVPLLEPSDSQECMEMMRVALEMSERFDTPVLFRTTTRVSHAQSLVDVDHEQIKRSPKGPPRPFVRNAQKHVMLPGNARIQRYALAERLERLRDFAETTPLNHIRWGDRRIGIVTHSMAYQYAREVFPNASVLKLGMSYPLPRKLIVDFAKEVETLLIIEELDPYLEEQIRALPNLPPVRILGKEVFPEIGEFSPQLVATCAIKHGLLRPEEVTFPLPGVKQPNKDETKEGAVEIIKLDLPARPPLLCAGCGHRGTFYTLRQLMFPHERDIGLEAGGNGKPATNPYARDHVAQRRQYGIVVNGDIGCYTLGALQPLYAMDTCGCMGASIPYALGMEKAGIKNKVVAVIGDSTFYHSGITGLIDVVTSGAATTVIILDNYITAMTGGNVNPGTGKTMDGKPARRVELETLCKALGIEDVVVINAYDNAAIERELTRAIGTAEPSVLIVREPCVLQERATHAQVSWVEPDKCVACWACLATACPALIRQEGKVAVIPDMCTDCTVCNQVCPHDAILRVDRERTPA